MVEADELYLRGLKCEISFFSPVNYRDESMLYNGKYDFVSCKQHIDKGLG
jgi:hypothetical protein